MNITHIIFSLQIGGAENIMIDIINKQISLEHTLNLIIINNEINHDILKTIDKRVNIVFINRPENNKNPFYILKLYFEILKLKTDIIHSHSLPIGKILSLLKIKKVLTVHDTGKANYLLNYYDLVFAISKAVKKDIDSDTDINSVIVYNGIEVDSILSKQINKSNNINKVYKIVQISRLRHHKKGQDLLINALNLIKMKNPEIHIQCDFIGEGPSSDYLLNLVRELSLEDRVNFLGAKSRGDIYNNLFEYDLLVQPSRFEGFGLTVIEAMIANIPVLVSNIEGPLELINNDEFGYSFESENIDDLANKILNIKENKNLNKIDNAYNYAKSSFDITNTSIMYLNYYNKILEVEK